MNTIILEDMYDEIRPTDIFTKLNNNRTFFIYDYIDDEMATNICASLLLKDIENHKDKITLFINSEKGDIRSVFMIYDTIKILKSPIETVCFGFAMCEIVLLLVAGTKGMRKATKSSIIAPGQLIHDESHYSNLTDAKSLLDRSLQDNKDFMKAIAKATGKKVATIMKDFERKKFMDTTQALKYGIIDEILEK
jgi:ATP-dependent Clp protease, protease subunit